MSARWRGTVAIDHPSARDVQVKPSANRYQRQSILSDIDCDRRWP
jgi:hypothetical protein